MRIISIVHFSDNEFLEYLQKQYLRLYIRGLINL